MKRLIFVASFVIAIIVANFSVSAETVRLSVVRDNWVSSVDRETTGNNGQASKLKLKGYQEFSLVDFDTTKIKGRKIEKATLHIKLSGDRRLYRVGISTLGAEWVEGTGTSYTPEPGSSCFRFRLNPDVPWIGDKANGPAYSDLTCVMFSEGGTFWSNADATDPVDDWQSIAVDPRIVAARAAGVSYGFVLFDDTGTELHRDGENVTIELFPNRFFHSRDQNASSAPYLTVELSDPKSVTPVAINKLQAKSKDLPPGEAVLSWSIPSLDEQETLGFFTTINGKEVPRYLIPVPSFTQRKEPQTLSMQLRDLALTPGETATVEIQAVDIYGNKGAAAKLDFRTAGKNVPIFAPQNKPSNSAKELTPDELAKQLSRLGNVSVAIIDELDKVNERGELIPKRANSYYVANPFWNASERAVRLNGAKNEFIGFQIHLTGDAQSVKPAFRWNTPDGVRTRTTFFRFEYVDSPAGKIADPMIPLEKNGISVKGRDTLYCEMFIPKDAKPGIHAGTLRLVSGDEKLDLNVHLTVHDFALPDKLSFLPEMNCYGLPQNEREYYRLAQEHRTYINSVPYSHRGTVSGGCAPVWDAKTKTFDWTAWDKRYAQYFDGTAFADLPRGAVPMEAFYLPLFENFPASIFEHYNGNDWADRGFTKEYEEIFQAGCREFAKHFVEKKWGQTCFHFYLNNKMDYKQGGWSRASSPWLLDEPASFRDFMALRYFGDLFQTATDSLGSSIRFRCDISRPQWQRDSLDGIMGVNVVGGDTFRRFNRMVNDRKEKFDEILYTYGTTCPPEEGAYQPVLWSIDAWTGGADGIVPWQTIGNDESWNKSDELAIFYPKRTETNGKVAASHRLKAYRRGQQDVEYLVLLQKKTGQPRWAVAEAVRGLLNLQSDHKTAYSEDAGTLRFERFQTDSLTELRAKIVAKLSEK